MNDLFSTAQAAGVTVEYCGLPLTESISVQDAKGDFVLLDYSLITAGAQERTHLAHELGHCLTGSFYDRTTGMDVRQRHENRADKWAIEHLVPQDALEKAVRHGYREVWELADLFDVGQDLMQKAVCWYRHHNLDVYSCT